jgi:hypothetical protein
MAIDQVRINRFLEKSQKYLIPGKEDNLKFFPANCYVQLGNFSEAQRLYELCYQGQIKHPIWRQSGQPNWLVDICVLSGRQDYFPEVLQELDAYRKDMKEYYYPILYSLSVMELLFPQGREISQWIHGLLAKPKTKDGYAMGQTLDAIVNEDKAGYNRHLEELLKIHEGMAKRGGLRETPEGLLCMPAMSLAVVAKNKGLETIIENDYLSIGYLEFLTK